MAEIKKEDLVFDEKGYKEAIESEFEGKYREVEKELGQKLVITIMGMVDVGKGTLTKQLLDEKYANFKPKISPIPGAYKDIEVYDLEENVVLVDTPGLEDVNKDVSQKTLDFVKESDIFLYLFNATAGVTDTQKQAFEMVSSIGNPVLVILNKIDGVINEEDRPKLIQHTKSVLGTDEVIATSAAKGYNIDKVIDWLSKTLKVSGKDLLFAKIVRERDKIVDKWIIGASLSAAAIGALPIPGSDIVPLTSLQIGLILKIAHVYGHDISRERAKALIVASATGMAGRTIFQQIVKPIPVVGPLISGIIAGLFTFALGHAMKQYFKSGMTIPIEDLADIGKKYLKEAKKYEVEFKETHRKALEKK